MFSFTVRSVRWNKLLRMYKDFYAFFLSWSSVQLKDWYYQKDRSRVWFPLVPASPAVDIHSEMVLSSDQYIYTRRNVRWNKRLRMSEDVSVFLPYPEALYNWKMLTPEQVSSLHSLAMYTVEIHCRTHLAVGFSLVLLVPVCPASHIHSQSEKSFAVRNI